MQYIPSLTALLTASIGHAQTIATLPLNETANKIAYTQIVQAPNATAQQLFSRAQQWFATSDIKPDLVDETGKVIIGKKATVFTSKAGVGSLQQTLWETVKIEAKDGRYRYEITDFATQPYVYSAANSSQPSQAQLKVTPIEETLRPSNSLLFDKSGKPKPYAQSIITAVSNEGKQQAESLNNTLSAPFIQADW